jgi:hypothetical protein
MNVFPAPITPLVIPQKVGEVTTPPVPEIVHEVSLAANPLPLTVTTVPSGPELGVREIEGPVTVNVAEPESPSGVPLTVIVYGPAATLPTVKLVPALIAPPVIPHAVGEMTTPPVPEIVHAVSLTPNPVPVTVTTVPSGPELGVRAILGPVTVKKALAESPA